MTSEIILPAGFPMKKKRQRAEDQTTITFSCSKELKDALRRAADADRRSLSNWIVYQLERELTYDQGGEHQALRVAEPKSEYGTPKKRRRPRRHKQ